MTGAFLLWTEPTKCKHFWWLLMDNSEPYLWKMSAMNALQAIFSVLESWNMEINAFFLSNKRCFTLQDFELCISKFSVILSNLEQHTCFQFNLFFKIVIGKYIFMIQIPQLTWSDVLWCYLTSLSWWREDQKRSWRTVHHQDSGIWVEIKHCRGKNQRWALTMFSLESFFNSQQRHLKLWNLSEMHLGFQLANEQGQLGVFRGNSHTSFLWWTYILCFICWV